MPIGAEIFAERMSRATYGVCRVEIAGNPAGTGFLIGPDTVITNFHVVEKALSKEHSTFKHQVTCRFDHAQLASGGSRLGRVVAVLPQCLDFSPYAAADLDPNLQTPPTDDELDYALLTLSEPVGNEASPMSPTRGWITIPETVAPFTPNQTFIIIQHPLTAPKQTTKQVKFLNVDSRGTRVIYQADTHPGSSGSPCFTDEYELAALHHRGDPQWASPTLKQGIPIGKIRARLLKKDLAAKIPECLGVESARIVLETIVDRKDEHGIARFISDWKSDIVATRDGVLRLKVQKQLHDFLHRCQKLLPLLLTTTESTDARNGVAILKIQGKMLSDDLGRIRVIAAALPLIVGLRPIDNKPWIDLMTKVAETLRNPASAWPNDYLEAIMEFRSEIRVRLTRINERLVDEVAHLPLGRLAEAFTDLATKNLFGGADTAGMVGAEAITRVASDLSQFIKDHDRWQEIDGRLWALEDCLASDTRLNRLQFGKTWEHAWEALQALVAESKDPTQSQELMLAGNAVAAASPGTDWTDLSLKFADFRHLAVDCFVDLDSALLRKCDEITALHEPLRRLTE